MLEYGQRLSLRQRNVLATAAQPEVATAMTLQAVQGGAQAAGRAIGGLAVGEQADLVALDAQHVALRDLPAPSMLSAHVFGSHRTSAIDSVWVGASSALRAAGTRCTMRRPTRLWRRARPPLHPIEASD